MNIYVVETAKKMAQAGVQVDIFTRANKPGLPATVEIADGVNVKHLEVGPHVGLSKEELPARSVHLLQSLCRSKNNYQRIITIFCIHIIGSLANQVG